LKQKNLILKNQAILLLFFTNHSAIIHVFVLSLTRYKLMKMKYLEKNKAFIYIWIQMSMNEKD